MSSNNAMGTYELGAQPVRRDQCDGGPMRWGWGGVGGPMSRREGGNERGDQWNGTCVGANWGTNEIEDQ